MEKKSYRAALLLGFVGAVMVLLFCSGCAGPGADRWAQSGVGQEQFKQDDLECWSVSQHDGPNYVPYRKCMKKRGWRRSSW